MASIGHPIVGDTLYGGKPVSEADLTGAGRHRAADRTIRHFTLRRIRLVHPIREKPLEVEAPLPETMERILELLGTGE